MPLTLVQVQFMAALLPLSFRTPFFQVHTFLPAAEWEGENQDRYPLAIFQFYAA